MAEPMDCPPRLSPNATTVSAPALRDSLLAAMAGDGAIAVDASAVENIGQAVLQILVAACAEARGAGRAFAIIDPSPAFVERVTRCRLAAAVGLETGDSL
ncbi:STAS domain-containing protein [uncultured Sphingomonas sp.]|uniref:STAS domain-containing protein n=1 Tax=uncultured Sphingomonas sp. TaxID=158754 RepID=UPI00262D36FE|nr:STAS domain-containing protein [uncultured Sphingomonas sp.]